MRLEDTVGPVVKCLDQPSKKLRLHPVSQREVSELRSPKSLHSRTERLHLVLEDQLRCHRLSSLSLCSYQLSASPHGFGNLGKEIILPFLE